VHSNQLEQTPEKRVEQWVNDFVIALNLCPFASTALKRQSVNIVVAGSRAVEACLQQMVDEADKLVSDDQQATTLLVLPEGYEDFSDYLDLLSMANALLESIELDGIIQIASFHPQYQFEGTQLNERGNWTNRAPYPILHLLTEQSVSTAVELHPNPEGIPDANIQRLEAMDFETLKKLAQA
jgi:hypothetical protein